MTKCVFGALVYEIEENMMEKMERVKRYMDILDKYDEVNSSYNWSILDELSDEDLYNEEKIVKKISVIQKNQERIENNPNRYTEDVMECVRQIWGLEKFDDTRDKEINQLSPDEVFNHVCNWNGLLGYATTIKSWIEDIYKVNFV